MVGKPRLIGQIRPTTCGLETRVGIVFTVFEWLKKIRPILFHDMLKLYEIQSFVHIGKAVLICLCIVYDCFCATATDLNYLDRIE